MRALLAGIVGLALLLPTGSTAKAQGAGAFEQALEDAVAHYTATPPPLPTNLATGFAAGVQRFQLALDLYFPIATPIVLEKAVKAAGKGIKACVTADARAGGGVVNLTPCVAIATAIGDLVEARLDLYGNEYGRTSPTYLAAAASWIAGDEEANGGRPVVALKHYGKALKRVRAAGVANPANPPPGPTPIPEISFPVVFVDGPRNGTPPGPPSLGIGEVEFPEIDGFAPTAALRTRETKLKVLHPDGTVETIFGSGNAAVLYPSVSIDGTKIYFAHNPDVGDDTKRFDVWRMDWTEPGRPSTNLTASYTQMGIFDGGAGPNGLDAAAFDTPQTLATGVVRRPTKLEFWNPFEYVDPDGVVRLMAVSTWRGERLPKLLQSVGDLVVMELDGANLRSFLDVPGGVYFAFQAPNGLLYWGEWAQEWTRDSANNFFVAKCNQDGTDHQQFDRFHAGFFDIPAPIRNSESPSVNGIDIVGVVYYAGNNLGWGALQALPDRLPGIEFSTNDAVGDPFLHAPIVRLGRRAVTAGPQAQDPDGPQPMKFRDPSPAEGEQMLVAYTPGPASHKMPNGSPSPWQRWDAGIYLCTQGTKTLVQSPADLVRLYDSPHTNSFMPRQIASYYDLFGVYQPAMQENANRNDGANGLAKGSPYSIARGSTLVGETATAPNPFALPHLLYWNGEPQPQLWNWNYTFFDGEWPLPKRFQGYENGKYGYGDLAFVRVLMRKPVMGSYPFVYTGTSNLEANTSFGAVWQILGEFDVRAGKSNPDDSSYKVKIPSGVPVMFQALDRFGMAVTSETFARETKPGAVMTCGGCHARGIQGIDFATTEAAAPAFPMHDAVSDHRIVVPGFSTGTAVGTTLVAGAPQTWYFEDVLPLFANCTSCHAATAPGGAAAEIDLRDEMVNGKSLYQRIARDYALVTSNFEGYDPVYTSGWRLPNLSRFIKAGSARESVLVWKLVGPLVGNASKRTDGRLNSDFPTEEPPGTYSIGPAPNNLVDVDNRDAGCTAHTFVQSGAISNDMVAKLIRWIDLGCPQKYLASNLPAYKGPSLDYTAPSTGVHVDTTVTPPVIHLGAWDDGTLDPASARVRILGTTYEMPLTAFVPNLTAANLETGLTVFYPVPFAPGQTVVFSVKDTAGNIGRASSGP